MDIYGSSETMLFCRFPSTWEGGAISKLHLRSNVCPDFFLSSFNNESVSCCERHDTRTQDEGLELLISGLPEVFSSRTLKQMIISTTLQPILQQQRPKGEDSDRSLEEHPGPFLPTFDTPPLWYTSSEIKGPQKIASRPHLDILISLSTLISMASLASTFA